MVITDLHVGDGGERDDYVQHPEYMDLLHACVQECQDRKAQLIITGDLFNAEYGPRACIDGPTLREACSILRPLKPIYCVGNHDSEAWQFKDHKIFTDFIIEDDVVFDHTLFMHGHQVDLFCGKWGWIGKSVSSLAAVIGVINPDWEDALRGSGGRDADDVAFANRAIAYAKKKGCNRVVCGHSHEPQLVLPNYCNAGLFTRDGWLMV
jgi:UDP-2,3-diacylglucosamine pyrophosphatase LpxH